MAESAARRLGKVTPLWAVRDVKAFFAPNAANKADTLTAAVTIVEETAMLNARDEDADAREEKGGKRMGMGRRVMMRLITGVKNGRKESRAERQGFMKATGSVPCLCRCSCLPIRLTAIRRLQMIEIASHSVFFFLLLFVPPSLSPQQVSTSTCRRSRAGHPRRNRHFFFFCC